MTASILHLSLIAVLGMLQRSWKKHSWEKKGTLNGGENAYRIQMQVSITLCIPSNPLASKEKSENTDLLKLPPKEEESKLFKLSRNESK